MSRFPQADFMLSVAAPAQFPADEGSEVAFAGRSNAGKSSAINAIAGRKALARTSKTPGRTQLLNYFDLGERRRIVNGKYSFDVGTAGGHTQLLALVNDLAAAEQRR